MNIVDGRHALYVGWVAGIALNSGIRLLPVVDDDGNYTDQLTLPINQGVILTVVVPYPPDDWEIDADVTGSST